MIESSKFSASPTTSFLLISQAFSKGKISKLKDILATLEYRLGLAFGALNCENF